MGQKEASSVGAPPDIAALVSNVANLCNAIRENEANNSRATELLIRLQLLQLSAQQMKVNERIRANSNPAQVVDSNNDPVQDINQNKSLMLATMLKSCEPKKASHIQEKFSTALSQTEQDHFLARGAIIVSQYKSRKAELYIHWTSCLVFGCLTGAVIYAGPKLFEDSSNASVRKYHMILGAVGIGICLVTLVVSTILIALNIVEARVNMHASLDSLIQTCAQKTAQARASSELDKKESSMIEGVLDKINAMFPTKNVLELTSDMEVTPIDSQSSQLSVDDNKDISRPHDPTQDVSVVNAVNMQQEPNKSSSRLGHD